MLTYIVKSGDWLAKIAEDHGSTVSAIWNHPENATHRQKRGSPDVLYPGDVLRIDVAEPVQPSAGAPPVVPPNPPEAPPTATLTPEWPYPPFEGPWSAAPTWECPGGTCACHPVPEDGPKAEHVIVFYDSQGVRMPGARCRVYEQGRLLTPEPSSTDGAGELRVELREGTATLRVEWAPSNLPAHEFLPYRKVYNVKMSDENGDVGLDRRLANLGFARGRRRRDNVADYQRAYSRDPNGNADEIRLEVLERHDHGTVTPFHPQGPTDADEGAPPEVRSLFASPAFRSDSSTPRLLAPQEPETAGGSSSGSTTASGQNVQGAAVPDAADLKLVVAFSSGSAPIDPKHTTVRLRPRVVPGLAGQPAREFIPTIKPSSPSSPAIYEFKHLHTGTYDALVYVEKVSRGIGKPETYALGHVTVAVLPAFFNLEWLGASVGRPVLTVDDPLLDFSVPPMQRRRKVLATLFEEFPMCIDPGAASKGFRPPYNQGEFKYQRQGHGDKNSCTAVTASMMDNALGVAFGEGLAAKPYFVKYANGLAPSVGDTVYYASSRTGMFAHIGIIVDSSAETDVNWIAADGGQPSNATELIKGHRGSWGRFWNAPDFSGTTDESSWFFPRRFIDRRGPTVVHGWGSPVWDAEKRHGYRAPGYRVVGWADISDPSLMCKTPDYTSKYTAANYQACKVLIRKVREAALADQVACRSQVEYLDPSPDE